MGADAHQPGDELTEQEMRDLDDWLARITQAMTNERGCMERRLAPDPRLTETLGQLCAIIADVMVKHQATITEALTNTPTRHEMKQLVNDLAVKQQAVSTAHVASVEIDRDHVICRRIYSVEPSFAGVDESDACRWEQPRSHCS